MEDIEEKANDIKIPIPNEEEKEVDLIMYHQLAPIDFSSDLLQKSQIIERKHINLLTYNIFLRPPLIKSNENDYKDERLNLFYEYLQNYDIICIQELFETLNQRKHEFIRKAAKYGFFFHVNSPMTSLFDSHLVDAGILIISRFPIKNWTFHPFRHGVYADGLAQKGFLYAQIEIKNSHIHLITTHLQADDTHYNICSEIRLDEIQMLNTFIANSLKKYHIKGDKILIAGDFNVDGNKYAFIKPDGDADQSKYPFEYDKMIQVLNSNGVVAEDLFKAEENNIKLSTYGSVDKENNQFEVVLSAKTHTISQMALDYIFDISFNDSPSSYFSIDKSSLQIEKFLNEQHPPLTQLSDHYGLSCQINYDINGINGKNDNGNQYNVNDDNSKNNEISDDILPLIDY